MADDDLSGLWDETFEPYATAIGYFVSEWNLLQEALCDLFCVAMDAESVPHKAPDDIEIITPPTVTAAAARAIWYALPSDKWQRTVMTAATKLLLASKAHKSVIWLADEANKLGYDRDAAVHSPVAITPATADATLKFVASYLGGHPHARKLKGKELISEFKSYARRAAILRVYAHQLRKHILMSRMSPDVRLPLPKKPSSPGDLGRSQSAKSRRRSRAK